MKDDDQCGQVTTHKCIDPEIGNNSDTVDVSKRKIVLWYVSSEQNKNRCFFEAVIKFSASYEIIHISIYGI